MRKHLATVGAVGLASLAFQAVDGAVLNGTVSKTANTCPAAIGAINGDDCSYNDSYVQATADPWVGPGRSSGFYSSSLANGNWTNAPEPGDGKVSPPIVANLTVSGGNQVSGTLVIGPVAINNFSAGPAGRGEDNWTSATITLAPKVADSVSGSARIIGSAGYPPYIAAANGSDRFPSETGADSNATPTPDILWWATPAPSVGITPLEGNTGTTGTMATTDVVNWACNDADGDPMTPPCSSASSFRGRGNFENILLRIIVDGANNPTHVEGFLVQVASAAPGVPNWVSWTFKASIDTDSDGVLDYADNCRSVANPTQLDTNGDGFGNICDADINNSGLTTTADFNMLRSVLNQSCLIANPPNTTACAADMNGSGLVTTADFNLLRARLNTAPGPAGMP